jgi:2-methylisocitrate lyase-like PEP mutase family enzyme
VLLVARTEIFFQDPRALAAAIDKLAAFADAGADCLYAPGVTDKAAIAAIVAAVAPKPVNVLLMQPTMRLEELAELGVRRISIGGALARVAYGAARKAAQDMLAGSFTGLAGAAPGSQFNEMFGRYS